MTTITLQIKPKEYVVELAKAMEAIKLEYENWGAMNTPTEIEKQVESRGRGAIIRSRLATATRAFEKAFSEWESDGCGETFGSYSES